MTDDTTEDDVSLAARVPWRRLANVVGLLLVLAVVVPFLVYAVPQVVGAEHSYVVLSGSMQPTMSPGDVVLVNDVPASEIAEGDVITYAESASERPTTHRVIEVVEQGGETAFRTQGDANDNPDRSLVTPADLEGKVVSVGGYLLVIPLIGYVIQFASTPLGLVALLILPLGALVVSEIWDVIATASGDSSAAAADGDDGGDDSGGDDGDGGGGDDATATAEEASESGIEDRETDLEPDDDGEPATIQELARTVEERPGSTGTSAAADGGASEAAVEDEGDEEAVASDMDEEPAGEADGADADEETEDGTVEDEDEEEGLVFSAGELQLGLLVLAGFFAYSLWVAYATFFEVWAFAVAASVAAALLLLGGLYLTGGEAEAAEQAETEQETADEQGPKDEQQDHTAADDGSALGTDDGESLFAPDEDPIAEREPEPTTAETAATGEAQVDVEELLSLGDASGVDPQHAASDLNGSEDALEENGRADAAEPPEVSDDD